MFATFGFAGSLGSERFTAILRRSPESAGKIVAAELSIEERRRC
jgi:hypothetical protein